MQKLIQQLEDLGKAYRQVDLGIDKSSLERVDSKVLRALNLESKETIIGRKSILRYALAFRGFHILVPETIRTVLKPVGVLAVLLVMVLGWASSVSIFEGVLPGDSLYGFKLATERVRVGLVYGSEGRTRLELELAGRRLDEVSRITGESTTDQNSRLSEAVSQFKSQIETAQSNLQNLTRSEQASEAVRVAKIIDRKATEYSAALNQAGSHATDTTQEKVLEARGFAQAASVSALTVLIDNHKDGLVSLAEVQSAVQNKLKDLEAEIQVVGLRLSNIPGDTYPEIESIDGPSLGSLFVELSNARKSLDQAKNYFVIGGFDASLNYYRDGIGRMNQLEWGVALYERAITARQAAAIAPSTNQTSEQEDVKTETPK